jgi:hypothetical protein
VAKGRPEQVAQVAGSYTGKYLKEALAHVRQQQKQQAPSPASRKG